MERTEVLIIILAVLVIAFIVLVFVMIPSFGNGTTEAPQNQTSSTPTPTEEKIIKCHLFGEHETVSREEAVEVDMDLYISREKKLAYAKLILTNKNTHVYSDGYIPIDHVITLDYFYNTTHLLTTRDGNYGSDYIDWMSSTTPLLATEQYLLIDLSDVFVKEPDEIEKILDRGLLKVADEDRDITCEYSQEQFTFEPPTVAGPYEQALELMNNAETNVLNGDLDQAISDYYAAIRRLELQTSDTFVTALIRLRLIDIYLMQGETKSARECLETLLEDYPDMPSYQVFLAELYYRNGQTEEALTQIENVRDNFDLNTEDNVYLNLLMRQMGLPIDYEVPDLSSLDQKTTRATVNLIPLGAFNMSSINAEDICSVISAKFEVLCNISKEPVQIPPIAVNLATLQYNGPLLADAIYDAKGWKAYTINIGITDVDITMPGTEYMFSTSDPDSRTAVVSTYRFDTLPGTLFREELFNRRMMIQLLSVMASQTWADRPKLPKCPFAYPSTFEAALNRDTKLCDSTLETFESWWYDPGLPPHMDEQFSIAELYEIQKAYEKYLVV